VDLVSPIRHRHIARSVTFGLLTLVLSLVPSKGAAATEWSLPQTVDSFLSLAARGISGTFSESYQVTQGSIAGRVDLAQEGRAGQLPLTKGPVRWSFVYLAREGPSRQWIERGPRAWDCVRRMAATKWTCSGPGQFEDSNGFAISITPYIPGVVLNNISEVTNDQEMHQIVSIRLSTSTSPQFGPLQCMEVSGTTSCLDRAGVLVSQQGGPYWTTVTLLQRDASVPASAFTLKGRSTSSGHKFEDFG